MTEIIKTVTQTKQIFTRFVLITLTLVISFFAGMYVGYNKGYEQGKQHTQTLVKNCKLHPGSCETPKKVTPSKSVPIVNEKEKSDGGNVSDKVPVTKPYSEQVPVPRTPVVRPGERGQNVQDVLPRSYPKPQTSQPSNSYPAVKNVPTKSEPKSIAPNKVPQSIPQQDHHIEPVAKPDPEVVIPEEPVLNQDVPIEPPIEEPIRPRRTSRHD